MENQFGEKIRELRAQKNLYLRQVASLLEMDTALLSKIEKGSRLIKRKQIPVLADILKVDSNDLLVLWLADQLFEVVKDEDVALQAMNAAQKKIKTNNLNKGNR